MKTDTQEKAQHFKDMVCKFFGQPKEYKRSVIITPYEGHYGLQGYVISVNGSPAQGTAILDLSREGGFVFWYDLKVKKIEAIILGDKKTVGMQVWMACIELLVACGLPTREGSLVPPEFIEICFGEEPEYSAHPD